MVALWHCVVPFLRRIKLQEPVRIGEKFSTDVAVPISRYNGGPVSPILKQFVLTYASLEGGAYDRTSRSNIELVSLTGSEPSRGWMPCLLTMDGVAYHGCAATDSRYTQIFVSLLIALMILACRKVIARVSTACQHVSMSACQHKDCRPRKTTTGGFGWMLDWSTPSECPLKQIRTSPSYRRDRYVFTGLIEQSFFARHWAIVYPLIFLV